MIGISVVLATAEAQCHRNGRVQCRPRDAPSQVQEVRQLAVSAQKRCSRPRPDRMATSQDDEANRQAVEPAACSEFLFTACLEKKNRKRERERGRGI